MTKKLEWEEQYSVGVKLIDDQHKTMFETVNLLIETLATGPKKEILDDILKRLMDYKKFHFATEERYFEEFNYEGKEEHKIKHEEFNKKLEEIVQKNTNDSIGLAYELIDYLEDWLIGHLMTEDQKYKNCFKEHGLT